MPHATDPGARVRMRMPLLLRRSLVFRKADGSELATVTLVWTTPAQWRRDPSRDDPRWHTIEVGGFVLAVRLDMAL
jgi:hypothetical protein